jgi:hypothetical protein
MGNTVNEPQRNRRPIGRLDKTDIKICCQQVFSHVSLHLNKKADDFKSKELEIAKLLKSPYFDRTDLALLCQSALKMIKYIKACKIVMKNCKLLEEKAPIIEIIVAKNSFAELDYLMTFIESIIWATNFLNLQQIKPFTAMIYNYFGPTIFNEVKAFTRVDVDLKACKDDSSITEISNYLQGVISRHGIINVEVKDILSEVKKSYNPLADFEGGTDAYPRQNDENQKQIKEIGTMLDAFDLNKKSCDRSNQTYLEVVKEIRFIGV